MFKDKKIVIGVSGGIAAYKALDIVSWLVKNQAQVQVVMTEAAQKIVRAETFQAISGKTVATKVFDEKSLWPVPHINIVEDADLFFLLPATANVIAKINYGLADDILSCAILAATCPVIIAPAMNEHMYNKEITQKNINSLAERGYNIIYPEEGYLACGTKGVGRLPKLEVLQKAVENILLPKQKYLGKKVLITAGPTVEDVDPVRFISNRSSGKMGYAIAEEAAKQGAEVILISGPVSIKPPANPKIKVVSVRSTKEMQAAVLQYFNDCNIVIKAAAVSDYRVEKISEQKIKKTDSMTLNLVKAPDILKDLGSKKQKQLLIGFAAESENIAEYAQKKLKEKNLDMIVANDITAPGAGFAVNTNIITMFFPTGKSKKLPCMDKNEVALALLKEIRHLNGFDKK